MAQTFGDELLQGRGGGVASSGAVVSWSAILAGAFASLGLTFILLALGSGLGFAAVSPWPDRGLSSAALSATAAAWLLIGQWISAGVGGYLAGRLRTRWMGTHTHEVFFRDTAHGLITWAVVTVVIAAFALPWAGSVSVSTLHLASNTGMGASTADLDVARKAAAETAIYLSLSLLVGAFIAAVAAALGGRQRDLHV